MKTKNALLLLLSSVLIGLASGCATSNKIAGASVEADSPDVVGIPSQARLFIVTPKVTFENIKTGEPFDYTQYGGVELAALVGDRTVQILKADGGQRIEIGADLELTEEEAVMAGQISTNIHRLFLSVPDTKVVDLISDLAKRKGIDYVLAEQVRAKVGPGAYYDFVFSGAMAHSTSKARFRGVLVDCKTGKAVWKNEVLLREVPESGDRHVTRALEELLATLRIQP